MKKRNLIFVLMAMTMLGGCGQQAVTAAGTGTGTASDSHPVPITGEDSNSDPQTLSANDPVSAVCNTSLQLLANTAKETGGNKNVLLSPTSAELALGMVQNGAAGDTLKQMEDVLCGGNSIDDMNPLFHDISERLEGSNDVKWNIANSIWYRDNEHFSPKPDFVQKTCDWYDAELHAAPFDDSTVADINEWVADETSGMIPQIINSIAPEAQMYLINAIAFEGEWETEYSEYNICENRTFTNADGSESNVTMLHSMEEHYFTLGEGTGFLRPYAGGEYSFFAILPDQDVSLNDYIEYLCSSDVDLSDTIKNCPSSDVRVYMPEFSADFETEMSRTLINMGMDLPFDPEAADFSNMSDTPQFIDKVIHKTHFEMSREGTLAAAVTGVETRTLSVELPGAPITPVITLDRPFIYGIADNETGLPVFLGCMNQMSVQTCGLP